MGAFNDQTSSDQTSVDQSQHTPLLRQQPLQDSQARTAKKPSRAYKKTDFYRQARHVHAWLSAFAFLMLMFFAATGLLLNHPDWMPDAPANEASQTLTLPHAVMQQVRGLEQPSELLLQTIRAQVPVRGQFKSSERMDDEWLLRLEGPRGNTDIVVQLATGQTDVTTTQPHTLGLLADLHTGKNVGALWSWLIDISAVVVLLLSLAGYVLFFSLKKRLSTSLWLTVSSVSCVLLLFWFGVQ